MFFADIVWKSRSGYELSIRAQLLFTTVVQKLNQGTRPGKGCHLSRLPFFGSFLGKQKRTYSKEQKRTNVYSVPKLNYARCKQFAHTSLVKK